ncbi:MAG: ANTAR domain-containing protein [Defluviitaleaceae bacterium]|nr:ANTAR domain-containing protein [Defluviitaleaceae bacterium]
MENALIVSHTKSSVDYFTETLHAANISQIVTLTTCGEARRKMLERSFDLVIVNAPLRDETGENFARDVSVKGAAQVILVVTSEHYDAVSAVCENDGVLTISKPVNNAVFWATIKLARASFNKYRQMYAENNKLKQKIDDIRIIDRAKCILISYMIMSEKDAHRYIEKQAMDMRVSKRAIAEEILKTYEN